MLADLLATPGVTEISELRSEAGVLALHGGLEAGTAEVAGMVATAAGASHYAVVLPADLRWHVPSTRFDPGGSGALRRFLDHVRFAVSFHGFGRPGLEGAVLLGGRNRSLAARLAAALRSVNGIRVIDDLDRIPRGLRGLHPRNPVNLPAAGGVQVELSVEAREEQTLADVGDAVATVLRESW